MKFLSELVAANNAEGQTFLHKAFMVALDDFAEHRRDEPSLKDSVTVAGALAVMSWLDAERIDPVRLVDDDRAETAQMMVDRCAAYAPLFADRAPSLAPWFDALGKAGPQVEAALDGGEAESLDPDWLERLAPTAFKYPATRAYLTKYIANVLGLMQADAEPAGALWVCLRFKRWFTPTPDQRARMNDQVEKHKGSQRHAVLVTALDKLDAAAPARAAAR